MDPASTATSPPSLVVRDVVRSYGTQRVLDGITLEQSGPGVVGLIGPNGSGKSTLLRCIAQLVEPEAGTIEVCGRTVNHADDEQARRLVGWVAHEALAWREQGVRANLVQAARLAGCSRRTAGELASTAIERWGLAPVAELRVRSCSRGWMQRYALARADLLTPAVLLLDEPTTGLDGDARVLLEAAIDGWRDERIVVLASHERDWLAERCDQVLDLDMVAARR